MMDQLSKDSGGLCGNAAQHVSRFSVFYYVLLALFFVSIIFLAFVNDVIGMSAIGKGDDPALSRSSSLCTTGIMNRPTFSNDDKAGGSFALRVNQACHLHFYTKADVTRCMDELRVRSNSSNPVHQFVFIGDSRIRQHFYNFIELIGNYHYEGQHLDKNAHMSTYSPLLNTRVSFYWTPKVDDDILKVTGDWASGVTNNPYFVVIGVSSHYMNPMNESNTVKFQNDLTVLSPLLKRVIHRGTRVVWWKQDPPFDPYINRGYTAEKMGHYDELALRVFKNYDVPMEVWDSTNAVTEEYVRSCSLFPTRKGLFLHAWMFCYDILHPGNSATIQGIQLLYNELCNRYI